jgi:glycerol-3-phosphate dehydrogenase
MAEGCVDKAAAMARLPRRPCRTAELQLHGFAPPNPTDPLAIYGTDAAEIRRLMAADPSLAVPLHPALPYCGAEVVWAVRSEMARTVLDVLTRRTRSLYLNTKAALETAPRVAELMARELGRDTTWVAEQVRSVKGS